MKKQIRVVNIHIYQIKKNKYIKQNIFLNLQFDIPSYNTLF